MLNFKKSNTLVRLNLLSDGQFADDQGVIVHLKAWRKRQRVRQVYLVLDTLWVETHKVYLEPLQNEAMQLGALLLRELDLAESLTLKDIFYDYTVLDTSVSGLRAYQFTFVKKSILLPYLKQLKVAGLKLVQLGIVDLPMLNLLPWRESERMKASNKQLAKLMFIPCLVLMLLYLSYLFLEQRNVHLQTQISAYYQKNLAEQHQVHEPLSNFMPAINLVMQLPAGVSLEQVEYTHHVWELRGRINNLQTLADLNQLLIQSGWLALGASVDLSQQGQEYIWQVHKLGAL